MKKELEEGMYPHKSKSIWQSISYGSWSIQHSFWYEKLVKVYSKEAELLQINET